MEMVEKSKFTVKSAKLPNDENREERKRIKRAIKAASATADKNHSYREHLGQAWIETKRKSASLPTVTRKLKQCLVNEEVELPVSSIFQSRDRDPYPDSGLKKQVAKALRSITPKEEYITRMAFGFNQETGEISTRDIADQFVVSRERIMQIIQKSVRKLGHPSRSMDLIDYHGKIKPRPFHEPEDEETNDDKINDRVTKYVEDGKLNPN